MEKNLEQFNFWSALEKPLADAPEEDWEALDRLAAMQVYELDELAALQSALGKLYPPREWAQ